jgi:hypothetical protein
MGKDESRSAQTLTWQLIIYGGLRCNSSLLGTASSHPEEEMRLARETVPARVDEASSHLVKTVNCDASVALGWRLIANLTVQCSN